MAQELNPAATIVTVVFNDSNLEIEACVDACLVEEIEAAVKSGKTGWVDLRVDVTAFGFTGEAYLAGVSYRTAHTHEDLYTAVKDNELVRDAVADLIETAKNGGWTITKQAWTVDAIQDDVQVVWAA